MKKNSILAGAVSLFMLLGGCGNEKTPGEVLDTPTSGVVPMLVDEVAQPLCEQLVDMFELRYPKAHLVIGYTSENEVQPGLVNDSARIALLTRKLSAEEVAFFDAK
ncbi:MAG: hypothetical protein ACRC3B_23435, partial [Bacteroidia bacterium]